VTSEIIYLDATRLAELIRAREISPVEVMQAHLGPLHGVPFTVKDSIDTARVLTQRGSPIFRGRTPDTDAVARLRRLLRPL
jgi:aspartyl-tRNA(Asn)/glutamyl-tRNA(Gln) amidotransferase subunit A